MGWLPLTSTASAVSTLQVVAEAAPKATYVNDRQGIYDPASHRTYIAYLGLERDLYVTYYDHHTSTLAAPVEVGSYPIADNDDHGNPSICLDLDGHIHIVWGAHNSAHRYSKSDNPWDISAWTTVALSDSGTYASINCDPASGDLIVIDRAGGGHGASFPAHEFGGIRRSDDGGATWSTYASLVDTTGAPGSANDFYMIGGCTVAPDGMIHFVWTISEGSSHDDVRTDLYHAYYNPADSKLYAADDTELGTSINWSDHSSIRIVSRNPIGEFSLAVAQGRLAVPYTASSDGLYVAVWDGSTWTDTDLNLTAPSTGETTPAVWPTADGWRAALPTLNGSFGDVVLYGALAAGTDWHPIATLLSGATGEGYSRAVPTRGGGPIVALTMEDPTGHPTTNATASDLLPIYAIFDTAYDEGSGSSHGHTEYVTTDGTRPFTAVQTGVTPTAAAHLATKGYVDGEVVSASGELLMQDGVTAPPVPIENEAQDDWLYAG